MLNVASEIKRILTMQEIVEFYGFEVSRSGFMKCPFHSGDNTASLKVYPGPGGFHCFGCKAHGTVIDFVMRLYDLNFRQAVLRINADFHLGRLTKNPELRHTQSGTPVASFRLAVDRDFKDKSTGERATDWIDVTAWRQTAEFVSRYFTKGRMAVVQGRLQTSSWTDKNGNRRDSLQVVADNVYFGDSQKQEGSSAPEQSYRQEPPQEQNFEELDDDQTELPF